MNLLSQYFIFQFWEEPKNILRALRNFLKFNLNYFSISLLLKTFFSHWHKYKWSYPRSFSFKGYLEVFFSNLISRILGAIMRSFLILFGLLTELFIFLAGIVFLLGWILLPFFLILGFYYGFKILF